MKNAEINLQIDTKSSASVGKLSITLHQTQLVCNYVDNTLLYYY